MNTDAKLRRLENLQDEIIATYVADTIRRGAEDYAPLYRKFPKLFKQLVKSEIMTDKGMRKYFRELSERANESLDWNEYERKIASTPPGAVFKADVLDYLVKAFWEEEILVLKLYLTGTLMDAIEAGGLYTVEDLNVDVPWSRNEPPVIDFMNSYTLQLSKGLTRHTQDRIYSALKESIANGENRDGATNRINQVINDPKRATTIAQTESVRAFTSGRMRVGAEIGANRKKWRTAGAKDYCLNFQDQGVVPWEHIYLTPRGVKVTQAPAHPNCRCGMQIFMPDEEV
jgi:hypothetical protein